MPDQSWPARDMEGGLPEHERDDERTAGGGIMAEGGTAIERGTDTISGPDAQGPDAGETGAERQFPPPVIDFGEGADDDEDVPDAVPPGNRATHA
jgi:hypothetical protein